MKHGNIYAYHTDQVLALWSCNWSLKNRVIAYYVVSFCFYAKRQASRVRKKISSSFRSLLSFSVQQQVSSNCKHISLCRCKILHLYDYISKKISVMGRNNNSPPLISWQVSLLRSVFLVGLICMWHSIYRMQLCFTPLTNWMPENFQSNIFITLLCL